MIQYNHHAALVHTLWRRNAKKNESVMVKIQQAAANNIISSGTWDFFLKNQPTKKTKIGRGQKLEKLLPLYLVLYAYHIKEALETTNKLEAGPAAKGRDNEGQTRRSHVCFGLVATCDVPGTCPSPKLQLFFNLIQMGPRKSRISEIPRPRRYANIK